MNIKTGSRIKIDITKCSGCAVCNEYCPQGLLAVKHGKTYVKEGCEVCGECLQFCIMSAISIVSDIESKT